MFDITAVNSLILRLAYGAGSKQAAAVYKKAMASGILSEPSFKINALSFVDEGYIDRLKAVNEAEVFDILAYCEQRGIDIITYADSRYPELLRNISDPPIVLFHKGVLKNLSGIPYVSIVGTRKLSEKGAKAAYSLASRLSRGGMTVVSGGALGADSFAHKGALSAGGITVAVLGCGIDSSYLASNKPLREEISKNGCLISEYPPKDEGVPYNFPVRNRIVSGMSRAVVMVEGEEKSGTMITVNHAFEQKRDVFAVSNKLLGAKHSGNEYAISIGAVELEDARQILSRYEKAFEGIIDVDGAYRKREKTVKSEKSEKILPSGLSKEAKMLYNYLDSHLSGKSFTADNAANSGLDILLILGALTELELEGLVESLPGGRFRLS